MNIEYAFASMTPIKGKDRMIYRKVCPCPHLALFSAVLTSIGFQGLCCVNYKLVDHRPFILEINPRFGGSLTGYFFSFLRHLDS
jgi:predicted ATP-grasp superfamily ATP-dependent carboligase